ncbi:MAG TPA: LysR substrate-binding domain-containing protein [bacterium]
MNLHQLRIFVTVAKRGSFSRAAEELHISQPSASIQVADLERALGVDLFEQVGRQIHLTEAGRVLEDYARRILALTEEARTAVSETAGLRRGHLAVGASPTPGTYLLPRIIAGFQERYPQVSISLHIAASTEVGERLMRHELDLGVVGGKMHTPGLQTEPFLDDEIVLVAAPTHPLAAAGSTRAMAPRSSSDSARARVRFPWCRRRGAVRRRAFADPGDGTYRKRGDQRSGGRRTWGRAPLAARRPRGGRRRAAGSDPDL